MAVIGWGKPIDFLSHWPFREHPGAAIQATPVRWRLRRGRRSATACEIARLGLAQTASARKNGRAISQRG